MSAHASPILPFAEGLRLLQVSRSAAYVYVADPRTDFPRPFKIGARLFYRVADLHRWLERKALDAQPHAALDPSALTLLPAVSAGVDASAR